MLISKHQYSSWREIQDQYHDYMTSLGPWDDDTVIEFLEGEYPDLSPHPSEQVIALKDDTHETRVLTFVV